MELAALVTIRQARDVTPNPEWPMQHLVEGQCGLCTHFGETHEPDGSLVQIRQAHEAPEVMIDDCGHPRHASLHLKVTPISGCDGYEPATAFA
ncbi:MAG TPA: hypothetical protein VGO40_05135 [Longimicrobium sp.]|jgi:hypothetical protein|nr:hypothetical protein [Longimicrobium sp.]